MYYIGIDVGFSGGICILNEKNKIEKIYKMPLVDNDGAMKHDYDTNTIINIINEYSPNNITLEYQHTRPGQGAVNQGRQMYGFGLLKGMLTVLCKNNMSIVDPLKWQNYFIKMYLTPEQTKCFTSKKITDSQYNNCQYLKYQPIMDVILDSNIEFKTWYGKWIFNKSTTPSKARTIFVYYTILKKEKALDDLIQFKYQDHNLVDSYLMARYCHYLNTK